MKGIVGTAGHIDHGKTALIEALTGEHTDRLPEELERGISIDLGFTRLDLGDDVLGVVDVPGHEDFIRNMLAGATGIDVLLLVVAADEGVMPQTREHVAIAQLLGVDRAVVALSKTDLVGDDWLGLVHDDLADFLAATPFDGAAVVPTSTVDGTGLEALRDAIRAAFAGARGRPDDLFRLPVDRVFTVRGTGTVVTGTVWSGRLEADTAVRLLPGGLEARVRGLQVHGGDVDAIEAGQRAAIALAGVDREAVDRGMTVVTGAGWRETSILDGTLRVLPGSAWSIESHQRVRVHLATAEVMARAVLLEGDRLDPGREGLAQLRLEKPLLARNGDRFVVRSYSPVTTIGGGVVAAPLAERRGRVDHATRARLRDLLDTDTKTRAAAALAAAAGAGVDRDALPILAGGPPDAVNGALAELDVLDVGGRVFEAGAAEAVRERILAAVDAHHRRAPLQHGADPEQLRKDAGELAAAPLVERVLDGLLSDGVLAMRGGRAGRAGHAPEPSPAHAEVQREVSDRLQDAGLEAPRLDELRDALGAPSDLDDLLALMEADGRLVRVEHDLLLDRQALDHAAARIRDRLGGRSGLSPGDFRDVLGVSRRHLIPLLEHFDRAGVTLRRDEGRDVPG